VNSSESVCRAAATVVVLMLLAATPSARAEPRFALREGMRCSHCHINRTGGGMRTPFGVTYSQTNLLSYRLPGVFDPSLGESVAYGGNLRVQLRTALDAKTKLGDMERTADASSTFNIAEGNIYLRAEVIPDHLTFYIDEEITPEGASSREAFVMLHGLPSELYVKAGRFLLPFGLRILDDEAFIRQETGFNYNNQDLGIEVGFNAEPIEMALAVTNGSLGGNDTNLLKQLTAQAVAVWDWGRVGMSFAWNDTSTEDFDFQSITVGLHAGVRLARLTLMAELDLIHGLADPEPYNQLALYTEANFEIVQGLYARFSFEAFDPLVSLEENERDRFVMGVSWFPVQFFEVRAEYRMNRDIPQRVVGNADIFLVQLHGFL